MKSRTLLLTSFLISTGFYIAPIHAQTITGTPGSPSATTTVDGRYLPNPPEAFGGEINLSAKDSKPYWPPQIVPPKGAPNILLIMTDDAGYGSQALSAASYRHRRSTGSRSRDCATRSSTPRRSARRHGQR